MEPDKPCATKPDRLCARYTHLQFNSTFCNRTITIDLCCQLDEFSDWLKDLKDGLTKQRLNKRLRKVQLGNLGDVAAVGEGVFKMREYFGPG
jgi:hypothetical protein